MCIIVYKPQGIKLFESTIKNCFVNNPDGAGFSYVENERVTIEKGFFTVDDFMAAYTPHETKQAVLHFRIKTHGDISPENCHPFQVTTNLVFAHNGTLWRMPSDTKKSDTWLFNELILQHLVHVYGKKIIYDTKFKPLLEGYTSGSKLVFLDHKGRVSILNEDGGTWADGCWFSNDSWKERVKYTYNSDDWKEKTKKNKKTRHGLYYGTKYLQEQESNVIPLPSQMPSHTSPYSRPLTMGDYVRLTFDMGPTQKGALGKVMGVYENGHIEVYFPLDKRLQRVPVFYLDRVIPTSMRQPEDMV